MAKFMVHPTNLQDVKLLTPTVHGDQRGFFSESYTARDFKEVGICQDFVQDNHSYSRQAGVLRGLHFQTGEAAQTKLIRVVTGVVYDVLVDLRQGSPTYLKTEGYLLTGHNQRQLLVPKGFAHGFVTLTDEVHFLYKCDNYYCKQAEGGISWQTPELAGIWPLAVDQALLSPKDTQLPTLAEFRQNNPFVYGKI